MKKLISTRNMDKTEWLCHRKKGIGGSDAGAVCGLNPYRSAMEVYLDKTTDDTEEFDNEAMRQGREFEDYVAKRFMEETGKKVRRAGAMFYDEAYPWMLADVDRLVVGERAGLECKTASPFMAKHWEDGKIPIHYQIQCAHYMQVCHVDAWYIAVLIYGREFKYYRMERDEAMLADLVKIESDFWNNHVLKRVLPAPDGSEAADTAISAYFGASRAETIPLVGFDDRLKRRQELLEEMERMETEKRQIEQELKVYLGEISSAENENYRVSWKSVSMNRLDEKRLKEEKPDIYDQYKREISSRRFSVKAA